jgi:hypothetical protein
MAVCQASSFCALFPPPPRGRAVQGMPADGEVVESFALSFKTVAEAFTAVLDFLGMAACDGTGVVKDGYVPAPHVLSRPRYDPNTYALTYTRAKVCAYTRLPPCLAYWRVLCFARLMLHASALAPCPCPHPMDSATKHNGYLSGVFLGGVRVLARVALVIEDPAAGCILKIAVRSEDPEVSRLVADCIH